MAELEPFLSPLSEAGFRVSWVNRITTIDTNVERAEAVSRLQPFHQHAVQELGGELKHFWLCEQVHGSVVVSVRGDSGGAVVPEADGIATNDPNVVLGIYVADCGALYIADPINQAISLLHSGKVGTEKNILAEGVLNMENQYGSKPEDLIVVLGPCIRPPAYEVDFSASIAQQARELGIKESNYYDSGICTTSDLSKYYSYRKEGGKTGRMLALLAL